MDQLDGPVVFDYRPDCEECNPPIYAAGRQIDDDEDPIDRAIEDRAQELYNAA